DRTGGARRGRRGGCDRRARRARRARRRVRDRRVGAGVLLASRRTPVNGDGEGGRAVDDADVRMIASGVVYEDNWMRLRRDQIERRDGSRGTYAFVQKRDFALVIPAEDDGFHLVE